MLATRTTVQTREELLDRLYQIGLGDIVTRHPKELVPVTHTKSNCALPGYKYHKGDEPKIDWQGYSDISCGYKHRNLIRAVEMGSSNPFILYSLMENSISQPHIRLAVLPGNDISHHNEEMGSGSVGDVVFYVQPYGPRAEELERYIGRTLANGHHAFEHGRCVGFFRAAVGFDERNNPILFVDTIQTDGNKKIEVGVDQTTHKPVYEHTLPSGLRAMYMDGDKPGVNAWHVEVLTAIEEICAKLTIPIAIPTWEEVVEYAENPLKLQDSNSAKRIYLTPEQRGYVPSNVNLRFPQKYLGINGRHVDVWLKK